ncbi:MAG: hypothetical protein IJ056_07310 [Acidaminococcaceae bacterium]|nr:hypothetical protein [Acidaminococcaceae bacterium]
MKRIMFLLMAVAVMFFSMPNGACEAKDVWVEHWTQENVDVYVMDETIEYEENLDGKFFRVSTKEVRNGKVQGLVKWKFVKVGQEMWRYETSKMSGDNMTVVSPGNKVFDFCMKRIGWNYRTEDFWCY